ncbi:MAG TPA: GTPase domain-containing protein [Tepidisphaeraceae bacterium]|jgi:hypothetical protein|nr:GTPase domain-containing protein [Tepidisphaeraceae bacterium]
MASRLNQIDAPLARLQHVLAGISLSAAMKPAVDRWRSDAAALRFHLRPRDASRPLVVAVIGGTGTGKSTLVNRLLGADASATSFRRTFTSGAVAVVRDRNDLSGEWLGVEHVVVNPANLPARGQNGALVIVPRSAIGDKPLANENLLKQLVLVDTPDLDGDHPVHHAEADRAFRWAEALIFLVTPEKYQMTELLPYYRLSTRYQIPSLFVMNKCEEQTVAEDYRSQLPELLGGVEDAGTRGHGDAETVADTGTRRQGDPETRNDTGASVPASPRLRVSASSSPPTRVYVIPRDDAAYDAPAEENLAALRTAAAQLSTQHSALTTFTSPGLSNRAADLIGRFEDQIGAPLRQERRDADRLIAALHDMETPSPGVDVNPVTQDLERRLQQRSVLYLIGPQRVLDRVRQTPAALVRLPRAAWDYVMRGEMKGTLFPSAETAPREVPDFKAVLGDQFSVLQSRIDDLLRTSPAAQKWIAAGGQSYEQGRLSADAAAKIADEELAELRGWLEKRWNATPRDTRVVHSLIKFLPGGKKLTGIAESAPYLLVIGLIATHAFFGTDLLVLGGYTVATWLTERLSNEVAARTRTANTRIADRFTKLAHEQIEKMCAWIDQQAAPARALDQMERAAGELAGAVGMSEA